MSMDAQAAPTKIMSERQLHREVVKLIGELNNGWRYFHISALAYPYGVRRGVLDLHCWNPIKGKAFWAELKSQKGKLRPEQERTLREYEACGVVCYVWRPSDWFDGSILEALR